MKKLYLNTRPGPTLYLEPDKELSKSMDEPELYLNISKANPHRDPTNGVYIAGGAIKSNTEDVSEIVNDLMDKMPGEALKKDE